MPSAELAPASEVLEQLKADYRAAKRHADEIHADMWRKAVDICEGLAGRDAIYLDQRDKRPAHEKLADYVELREACREAQDAAREIRDVYTALRQARQSAADPDSP